MSNFREMLIIEFQKEGFDLTSLQIEQFIKYKEVLLSWNEKINLTTIVDDYEIVIKHFLDSVLILKYFDIDERAKIVDIGSGAGFPSVPMKIMRADISITMMDSLNKRIIFLEKLLEELDIEGRPIHIRGEEAGVNIIYRERFDIATARAVTRTRELAELCLPLVKIDGYFLPLKAGDLDAELNESKNAIKAMGGSIEKLVEYNLGIDQSRSIPIIRKVKKTPNKYPRQWGHIKKTPLI